MKTINCAIIDDDPNSVFLLEQYLRDYKNIRNIGSFTSPITALKVIQKLKPELIFLDVNMPELNGMELINQLGTDFNIILTTGSRDYALASYEYNVIDYLLKPITEERFAKSINKFKEKLGYSLSKNNIELADRVNKTNVLFVKQNYRTIQIPLSEILYMESDKEYVRIVTSQETYKTKQTLSYFEKRLSDFSFVRIHRSFIVPSDRISSFSSTEVNIDNKRLPVGRSYQKALSEMQTIAS